MQAALALAGPAGLGLVSDPGFELTPHIELINREIVETMADAEGRRSSAPQILLVSVPPRHGKSTLISQVAPAWYLGMFPDRQVMLTSYEADFAGGWGMRVRDLLAEHGEAHFGVKLDRANRAARRWRLEGSGGGMISAGVGGAITGRGAHLLIIDDPVKNAEEAMSETIRKRHWEWWLSTARSRLEPGAVVLVLMTRWHQGDLGGRMLTESAAGGDPVREIRLPALAEEADPLGRERGAALWPQRYSKAWLHRTRAAIGPYWFSAMYQGRPTPDEGGIFDRRDFRYFEMRGEHALLHLPGGETKEIDPGYCRKATYVDLAVSEKETADYTVLVQVWVTEDRELLIQQVIRRRIPGPAQAEFLENNHIGLLKVESIGYQAALIQALVHRGLPVEPVHPDKDKVTRASAAGALYKQGKVFHRLGASWLHDFEAELLAFPAGEHDDQVDALAYAARDLPNIGAPRRVWRQMSRGKTIAGDIMNMQF
jgi:predicted phage terminase large subunit-like protein